MKSSAKLFLLAVVCWAHCAMGAGRTAEYDLTSGCLGYLDGIAQESDVRIEDDAMILHVKYRKEHTSKLKVYRAEFDKRSKEIKGTIVYWSCPGTEIPVRISREFCERKAKDFFSKREKKFQKSVALSVPTLLRTLQPHEPSVTFHYEEETKR
jgi:hypothetical protein